MFSLTPNSTPADAAGLDRLLMLITDVQACAFRKVELDSKLAILNAAAEDVKKAQVALEARETAFLASLDEKEASFQERESALAEVNARSADVDKRLGLLKVREEAIRVADEELFKRTAAVNQREVAADARDKAQHEKVSRLEVLETKLKQEQAALARKLAVLKE